MLALRLAVLITALLPFLVMAGEAPDPYKKIKKKHKDKNLLGLKSRYESYLTATPLTKGPWDANYIPSDCEYYGKKAGVDPEHMVVYNVTYNDCHSPWYMCFDSALKDHDGLLETFSRLPVHMRSWVKHLIAFHIDRRPRASKKKRQMATMDNGNMVLYGPVKEWLDIMLHQAGHALDQGGAYGEPLSGSEELATALERDRRLPSKLAKRNMFELVAENTILAVYFKAFGIDEIIEPIEPDPEEGEEEEEIPEDPEAAPGQEDPEPTPGEENPEPTPGEEDSEATPGGDDGKVQKRQKLKPNLNPLPKDAIKRLRFLRYQQDLLNVKGRVDGKSIFEKGGSCSRRVLPSSLNRLDAEDTGGDRDMPLYDVLSPGIEPITLAPAGMDGEYKCQYPEGK